MEAATASRKLPSASAGSMSVDGLNVIALISGGKDSFYSLLHCVRHGHRIVALANLFPVIAGDGNGNGNGKQEEAEVSIVRPDQRTRQTQPPSLYPSDQAPYADLNSFMYQTVGHEVIPLYAQATGLPLYRQPILGGAVRHERDYDHQPCSSSPGDQGAPPADDETESMLPLLSAVKAHHPEANALCSGAILSTYQRTRVESVALRLGLTPLSYLWKYPVLPPPQATLPDEAQLLRDMAAAGLEARIIKVASAGLDEKHLWEMVTSETGVRRLKASLRKFGFAQGASLGEGGEFETIVVDGPEALFKKRISIPENGRLVVPEGGGSTWLMLRGARLENKARGADDNDAQLAVREPAMLDAKFQTILDSMLDSSTWPGAFADSAYTTKLTTSGLGGKLSLRAASDVDNIHWAVVADSHALGSSVQRETVNVVQKIRAFLSSHGLQSRNISSVIVVLQNMSDFPKFNEEYGKLFPNANPPSRITVSCGDSVPEGHNVVVYLTVPVAKAQVARNGLHVQSRSYWAPANIGPYSQAIETAVTVGGNPTALRTVSIAGQIPLIPASMVLPPSSAMAVQEQVVLSLQHLWRIGAEMKVQCWGSAVAYFSHQPGEDSIEQCAKLAGQAWSLAHGSPYEDENEDEADGPDPWDLKYNSQYRSLGSSSATSTCSAAVPDWSIYTLQQQNEPTSCIAPMFTAEIESLPRESSVEWHAHAGMKGIEEGSAELIRHASLGGGQWRSWNLVIKTSRHMVLYTTLAKLIEDDESGMAGFSSSERERQLRNAYSESLHSLLPNTEAPDTLEPYLAYVVDGNKTRGLWTLNDGSVLERFAVVPCRSLWTSRGERLGLLALYKTVLTIFDD